MTRVILLSLRDRDNKLSRLPILCCTKAKRQGGWDWTERSEGSPNDSGFSHQPSASRTPSVDKASALPDATWVYVTNSLL